MRRFKWAPLLMLVMLLLSQTVAQAAVIPVDPRQPARTTATKEDYQKITALMSQVIPVPVSPVSPDDQSVLVAYAAQGKTTRFAFVDTQNGKQLPLRISSSLPTRLTNLAWYDENTLIYPGYDYLVYISRKTGSVFARDYNLPKGYAFLPVYLSPNGRSMLVAYAKYDAYSLFQKQGQFYNLFDQEIKTGYPAPAALAETENPVKALKLATTEVYLGVLDIESGDLVNLNSLEENTGIWGIAWSRDNTKVAVGRTTVPQVGRTGNPLSDKAVQDTLGALPPDKNPFRMGQYLDIYHLDTGKQEIGFLKASEDNGDFYRDVDFSTDGFILMVQMAVPGKIAGRAYPSYLYPERSYLRFYDRSGELLNTFESPEIDAPIQMVARFMARDEILIQSVRGTNVNLYYYNRATGIFSQLPTGNGSAMYPVFTSNRNRQVIFTFSSFTSMPELFRLNWNGSFLYEYTFNNLNLNAQVNKVRADEMKFTLSNGQVRSGYLIQPADAAFPPQNAKVIVWQEGGPGSPMVNDYQAIVERPWNLLANFGYSVLFVPLSGREGYGSAFYNALADNENFGKIDIDEMAQIVNQMYAKGYTSPGKVGITGCSYGGYFTSQSITRHPDLYAAANAQCSLLDLFDEWQFGYTTLMSYLMGAAPTTNPAAYVSGSPLYNSGKLKTPLLIFHGTADFLPQRIAVNFHDQTQANGAAVNLLSFAGEGHGLSYSNNQYMAAQAQLDWFNTYLK